MDEDEEQYLGWSDWADSDLRRRTGLGVGDYPNHPWYDWFLAGLEPSEAVDMIVRETP